MNLASMRTLVRRDLKDEDASAYRWTNDEVDRFIEWSLRRYSEAVPDELKATIATTNGSRVVSVSTLSNVICYFAVEFPVDKFPRQYQRFSVYGTNIELLGDVQGDGTNCYVYYGKMHDSAAATWTVKVPHEPVIALGAAAHALVQYAVFTGNRVNAGGVETPRQIMQLGWQKLQEFEKELKKLKSRVRKSILYVPAIPLQSQTTDWGPG